MPPNLWGPLPISPRGRAQGRNRAKSGACAEGKEDKTWNTKVTESPATQALTVPVV
jgi:hypothetical protein